MKKLIPLLFLVACADPNAELLAKYKNLEIENKDLLIQLDYQKAQLNRVVNEQSLIISQCKDDLKYFVCKHKKDQKTLEYRVLCDGPIVVDLPSDEE